MESRLDRILRLLYGFTAVGYVVIAGKLANGFYPIWISGRHSVQVTGLMFDCRVR